MRIYAGIWDQDLDAKTSLAYPELYRMGIRNDKFKVWQFWVTIFDSIYQSVVCFFFPYMLLKSGTYDKQGYNVNGIYEIGTIMATIGAISANFFIGLELYSYTWIQIGIIALSILVLYAFICIYAQFATFIMAGQDRLFGTGYYWLILLLTIVTCFLPRFAVKYYIKLYHPYDNDIIREIELVQHRGRVARKASVSEDTTH